jgi:ABC-type antimicrobial peptide transport system permease subunit
LGQTVVLGRGRSLRVVGVVPDVRDVSITEPPVDTVYIPNSDYTYRRFTANRFVLVRSRQSADGDVSGLLELMANDYGGDPVTTLSTTIGRPLLGPRAYAALSAVFAWAALLLAVGGTHALTHHLVGQRRAETAVRIVCGATPGALMARFARWFGVPIGVGLLAGTAFGLVVADGFTATVYPDVSLGLVPTVAAAVALAATAASTALIPAYRMARKDPGDALRAL